MIIFVLNKHKQPLMPCSPAKSRKLLKEGKAKVIRREPFTIKLHGNAISNSVNIKNSSCQRLSARTTTLIQRESI